MLSVDKFVFAFGVIYSLVKKITLNMFLFFKTWLILVMPLF